MMIADWELKDFDIGAGVPARAFDPAADNAGWIPIKAPGDIYLALHAADRIPHPFVDGGEEACAWVVDREWWERTRFNGHRAGGGERQILTLHGLDTFAEVWLNGDLIGRSDNMFVPLEIDVTDRVKDGENVLA